MMVDVYTEVAGSEVVDELEPLWLALLAHQTAARPDLSYQPPELSWQTRRSWYLTWLFDPDSFVVVARHDFEPVGYALVEVSDGPHDTWRTGRRLGALQSLSVDPEWRGRGIGTSLLNRVDSELAGRGVSDMFIEVTISDDRVRRFYQRRGFAAMTVRLGRLGYGTRPQRLR